MDLLPNDPFQPVVPWNVAAILVVCLLGVVLMSPNWCPRAVAPAHRASDDAYGVYLAQMLFVDPSIGFGRRHLDNVVPWPRLMVAAVALVLLASCGLDELPARTPLAEPLTGRQRVRWPALVLRRTRRKEGAAVPAEPIATTSATESVGRLGPS
jgi:hypothetical protein